MANRVSVVLGAKDTIRRGVFESVTLRSRSSTTVCGPNSAACAMTGEGPYTSRATRHSHGMVRGLGDKKNPQGLYGDLEDYNRFFILTPAPDHEGRKVCHRGGLLAPGSSYSPRLPILTDSGSSG